MKRLLLDLRILILMQLKFVFLIGIVLESMTFLVAQKSWFLHFLLIVLLMNGDLLLTLKNFVNVTLEIFTFASHIQILMRHVEVAGQVLLPNLLLNLLLNLLHRNLLHHNLLVSQQLILLQVLPIHLQEPLILLLVSLVPLLVDILQQVKLLHILLS